jgi:hypothetical protein
MMAEGTREFIPIFNATLTAILLPNLRVESAGMLINRRQIDLVAMLNQRASSARHGVGSHPEASAIFLNAACVT